MTAEKKIRVLVTGTTGFLGGNVLRSLMAHPAVEPIAACRRRGKLARDFRGEVRAGDLLDDSYRREAVENIGSLPRHLVGFDVESRTARTNAILADLKAEGYPWPRLCQPA